MYLNLRTARSVLEIINILWKVIEEQPVWQKATLTPSRKETEQGLLC